MIALLVICVMSFMALSTEAFSLSQKQRSLLIPNPLSSARSSSSSRLCLLNVDSLFLSDISVSEEEVLEVAGRVSTLPDPIYAVGFAALIFLGVAILQFSLGDLTKEVLQLHITISH